jgi:hypothetical protein
MPLPQIRDGQKISLMLPADVVRRLKIEAMEDHTIPALILLEALDGYWGGNTGASDPTVVPKDPAKRQVYTRLLHHLEALVSEKKITFNEIAKAAGTSVEEIGVSWRTAGYVPVSCVKGVIELLAAKNLPLSSNP